jgi:hypothetical protein
MDILYVHTYITLAVTYNRLEYIHARLTVYIFLDLTAVLKHLGTCYKLLCNMLAVLKFVPMTCAVWNFLLRHSTLMFFQSLSF